MGAAGRQWVGLIHPAAEASREALARHLWFVATRLGTGAAALACVPVILALHGSLAPGSGFALALLAGQAVAGVYCVRSGRLGDAYRASLVCFALLSGFLLVQNAPTATVVLGLVPLLIIEAALIAGRREFTLAVAVGCALPGFLLLDVMLATPLPGPDGWTADRLLQHGALTTVALGLGILVMREIRQRRARERQLAVQGEIISRGFGDLVTRHDSQGLVLSAGPSARGVLGVAPEALLGRGLLDLVHVADRPAFLKAVSDAVQGEALAAATIRVRSGGGREERHAAPPRFGWFEVRIQLVHLGPEADGEPDEIVCVLRDVTSQRLHEEEIEEARAQAVSASSMKSSFLATVSHELRTPLNAIIGFSEMLSSEKLTPPDDERRRDYARIIHLSGQHLLDVVNTLLDISRIDSGTLQLDPEPFAIDDVVAGALAMMTLKAEQAGLKLTGAVEPGLPRITADKRAMKQILLNLISNGVKFTPSGGSVAVRVMRDGEGLRLCVEDDGIGIKPDDVARLGEPFFQAQSSYDRRYEGTGLGLCVVKGLVALHGGTLAVDSHLGQGTRVTVRMPMVAQPRPLPNIVTALAPHDHAAAHRNDNTTTVVKKRA